MGSRLTTPSLDQLRVSPRLCLKLRHRKSNCRLCLDSCPCGAINIDDSLHIDDSLCRGCGICVNVCPTGVFGLGYLSNESLLDRVKEQADTTFTCSRFPQEDWVEVPCLGHLNEALLIGAAISVRSSVRLNLDISRCKQCQFAAGLQVIIRSLRRANQILAVFGAPGRVSVFNANGTHSPGKSALSRRIFFSYLLGEMRGAALENGENTGTAMKTISLEPTLPKKHAMLLEQIRKLGQPVVPQLNAERLPFAEVVIGEQCDGCGMCVTFCPTGALRQLEKQDSRIIDFALAYCLACSLCSDVCPAGTITCSHDIAPSRLVSGERKILIELEKSVCPRCGQGFIASGGSLCLECRKKEVLNWLPKSMLYYRVN